MLLSDMIAYAIEELLDAGGGAAELQRKELAGRLGCVPSQINYVLASRFTPERGYAIESRRGGGGYIRIVRCALDNNTYLMHFLQTIGPELDAPTASAFLGALYERELLTGREARMLSVLFGLERSPVVRAEMLRRVLVELLKNEA